jgi:large subunit ribosomal protein L31
MQKEKHAAYQDVLFVDSTTGLKFVCGTTITSDKKEKFEGRELPVVTVPISAASHPLFVGGKQIVDAEGRVDRFKKRYQTVQKVQPKVEETPVVTAKKTAKKK